MSQLRQAKRFNTKIKMGISGPAGSGKTYSALLVANGIEPDWSKIAVICTEFQDDFTTAADLYQDLGAFNVLPLKPPYRPERYTDALDECIKAGMSVVIIDSMSHEWEAAGGLLEENNKQGGNSFTNWNKLGQRHRKFVDKITTAPVHVIGCFRTKTDYVLEETTNKQGKTVQSPKKVGLKIITREGFDYEMTLFFEVGMNHYATCTKDRTHLFMDEPTAMLDQEAGRKILNWCNGGVTITPEMQRRVVAIDRLRALIVNNKYTTQQVVEITGLQSSDTATLEELEAAIAILEQV